jgi:hypothetical protein
MTNLILQDLHIITSLMFFSLFYSLENSIYGFDTVKI